MKFDSKKTARLLAERWHEVAYILLILALIVLYQKDLLGKEYNGPLLIVLAVFVVVIAFRVEQLGTELSASLKEVLMAQNSSDLERVEKIKDLLDPGFKAVFGRRISNTIENLTLAVKSHKIEIHGQDEFRSLYKETLSNFPKGEFLATSIPSKAFFWRDPSVDDAIARFIAGGGSMKRIFFVDAFPAERDSEAWEIIARHESLGVEVWIAYKGDVPNDLFHIFLVEATGLFSWDIGPGSHHEITRVSGTSDRAVSARCLEQWRELVRLGCAKRFSSIDTLRLRD